MINPGVLLPTTYPEGGGGEGGGCGVLRSPLPPWSVLEGTCTEQLVVVGEGVNRGSI